MARQKRVRWGSLALIVGVAIAVAAPAGAAEWKLASADGDSSIKFGFLLQGRAEMTDFISDEETGATDTMNNLYLRRARLLIGGQLAPKWTFFIETDSPNLGKGETDGTKTAGDVYIQDWVVTYNQSDAFKLDMGMLLVPLGHNHTQSAATLLPVDYGGLTFVENTPLDERVGRDYGVLARGLVAKHFEYRVGILQGNRGTDSTNDFRYTARVAYNIFDAEAGLFYTGTTLGKKHILTIGASYDAQEDYSAYGADVFYDQPIGSGGLTVQANWYQFDGDVFVDLPKQTALQAEAGYYFGGAKIMPYVTYGTKDFDDPASADVDYMGVGVGWYLSGFNRVLKLEWDRTSPTGGTDLDQVTLQMQIFQF